MPRPSAIPQFLALEATVVPRQRATMRNEKGKTVSVALFCTERKIKEFQVVGHGTEDITIEAAGYRFLVTWDNAQSGWGAGKPAPERFQLPTWARQGASMRYVSDEPLRLASAATVTINRKLTGRFIIHEIYNRHLLITAEGIVGTFRLDLDESFTRSWAQAADNHNDRINQAKFIQVGRRIMPIDVDGNYVGATSYLVTAYDAMGGSGLGGESRGGVMRLAPLLGDGIRGPEFEMPCWNSADMWALAPDDPSKVKLVPGESIVRHNGEDYKVVAVDEVNKRVTVERVEQSTFRLGDPAYQPVDPPKEEPARQSRFTRRRPV